MTPARAAQISLKRSTVGRLPTTPGTGTPDSRTAAASGARATGVGGIGQDQVVGRGDQRRRHRRPAFFHHPEAELRVHLRSIAQHPGDPQDQIVPGLVGVEQRPGPVQELGGGGDGGSLHVPEPCLAVPARTRDTS